MSILWDLLDLLQTALQALLDLVIGFAKAHPVGAVLAALALLRLFGTTIQTGQKGVLFVFGRVRRELEPGFHPLLPVVMTARKTPVRSVTLDLPRQRITTADDLVYDVQANIVYRVVDPKLALTQVDNLRKGIEAVLPLIAADLLRGQTRTAILDFKVLEADLIARAEQKLQRWGVTVEQAGFKSIAPTKKTLRLTQLFILSNERKRVLEYLIGQGAAENSAVALLGADRRLVSHSTARYHALHRLHRPAPVALKPPLAPSVLPGEKPKLVQQPPQADKPAAPVTEVGGVALPTEGAPAAAPARPKKTTKGIQVRSWMRLRERLQSRSGIKVPPVTMAELRDKFLRDFEAAKWQPASNWGDPSRVQS